MEEYKISVIVPIYKVEKYLNKCIDSIINQTYKNLEIILVDDGSPDDCGKICDEYAKKDSRIKVIHKENGGLSSARNSGLDIATGNYIGFVDSDDWIDIDMYETMMKYAISQKADIIRCGIHIHENGKIFDEVNSDIDLNKDMDVKIKELIDGGILQGAAWNKLYKKFFFDDIRYDETIFRNEDSLASYYILKKAKKVIAIKECKYNYLIRQGSIIMSGLNLASFDMIRIAKIFIDNEINNKITKSYCLKRFVFISLHLLTQLIRENKFIEKFNDIRSDIIKYKKEIYKCKIIKFRDKVKISLVIYTPFMYKFLVKRKR